MVRFLRDILAKKSSENQGWAPGSPAHLEPGNRSNRPEPK